MAALTLYLAAQTQWRYSGMGQPTGLDYAGVEALARLRGEPLDPETFALLQVAERAALAAMGERAERARGAKHG